MAIGFKAIQRLTAAADLKPVKRTVVLRNGDEFTYWASRLTMAERERAQRETKSDDAGAYALQLLVNKALDENGQRMFTPGDIAELKHSVEDSDLQALMLALLTVDEDAEPIEPKSTKARAEG
jgi:hypothetical protein